MAKRPPCQMPLAIALALAVGCGGAMHGRHENGVSRVSGNRPPVLAIVREGDPESALALAVMTGGIAKERGAEPAVALAALVQARLAARWRGAVVTPSWEGYRVRGLVEGAPDARIDALRGALLAPVGAAEMPAIKRKLDALAKRPLHDAALADIARCRGEPFGLLPPPPEATLADVESWRREAHALGRVALSVVGVAPAADALVGALNRAPVWPRAQTEPRTAWSEVEAPPVVYEARGESSGEARATIAFHTGNAMAAVSVAPGLADPRGALASRLMGFEGGAAVHELSSTAHPNGGCLSVSIDFRDLGSNPAARIAQAVALVRQEVFAELGEAKSPSRSGMALARRAGDAREAAERGAWWTLVEAGETEEETRAKGGPKMMVAVGFSHTPKTPVASAMKTEIDRALAASREKVVDARVRVERGQSDLWVLVGSPCGTLPEVESDAGLGAAFAVLAAEQARRRVDPSLEIAPWASYDAVGVIAHGPNLEGESPVAHARRIADAAARSFAAENLDPALAARARRALLSEVGDPDDRALGVLANGIVPGHPSWFAPGGSLDAVARSSDGSLGTRAASLRSGPLRVAVLANGDSVQAAAAVQAVDRWIPRRPGEVRACPTPATPPPSRPGTYAIEQSGSASEAWLGLPLPRGDERARALADYVARALDGEGGLLAKALGDTGLARTFGARVVGPTAGAALVIRITSAEGALDAAVSQTRALLDRLRQRGLDEAERKRAQRERARGLDEGALAPEQRLLALFRGDAAAGAGGAANAPPPSLDALRSFMGTVLRDDALVVVAARPPRPPKIP